MGRQLKNRLRLAIVSAALVASALVPAAAWAFEDLFADHVQIYSGGDYKGVGYHSGIDAIAVNSTGTAYSGAWIVNSSGVRVSVASYCETPGCVAGTTWSGPYPNGYGNAHNHGNASPSYFNGSVIF